MVFLTDLQTVHELQDLSYNGEKKHKQSEKLKIRFLTLLI
jgi:hypothetical protein